MCCNLQRPGVLNCCESLEKSRVYGIQPSSTTPGFSRGVADGATTAPSGRLSFSPMPVTVTMTGSAPSPRTA